MVSTTTRTLRTRLATRIGISCPGYSKQTQRTAGNMCPSAASFGPSSRNAFLQQITPALAKLEGWFPKTSTHAHRPHMRAGSGTTRCLVTTPATETLPGRKPRRPRWGIASSCRRSRLQAPALAPHPRKPCRCRCRCPSRTPGSPLYTTLHACCSRTHALCARTARKPVAQTCARCFPPISRWRWRVGRWQCRHRQMASKACRLACRCRPRTL